MNIRITNRMINNKFLNNLSGNMASVDKYQNQLSTGRKLQHLYDDPAGILKSMSARVRLYRIEQYEKNVSTAREWLTQTETGLTSINKVITTAYENIVQIASGTWNPDDREKIGQLIGQLRDQVMNFANDRMSDRYLFGGFNTTNQPFTVEQVTVGGEVLNRCFYNGYDMTDTANADLLAEGQQILEFEVGFGLRMDVSFNGTEMMGMGNDNIYNIFEDLYQVLMNGGQPNDVSPYITKLQDAQKRVLSLAADVGGRDNRLQLLEERYADDFISYTDIKSNVEDADEAEAAMNFKMAEAVYQSSLSVGAQIMQISLLDYIR